MNIMELERELLKVIKLLKIFDKQAINVNLFTSHDVDKLVIGFPVNYAGKINKEKYPIRFFWNQKLNNTKIDLNIDFCAVESNENHVVLEKDKMLSKEKLFIIKFYVHDRTKIQDAFNQIFVPWANSRKKY